MPADVSDRNRLLPFRSLLPIIGGTAIKYVIVTLFHRQNHKPYGRTPVPSGVCASARIHTYGAGIIIGYVSNICSSIKLHVVKPVRVVSFVFEEPRLDSSRLSLLRPTPPPPSTSCVSPHRASFLPLPSRSPSPANRRFFSLSRGK